VNNKRQKEKKNKQSVFRSYEDINKEELMCLTCLGYYENKQWFNP